MKTIGVVLISIVLFLLLLVGCQDETLDLKDANLGPVLIMPRGGQENLFVTGVSSTEDTIADYTILGAVRPNPYTVENFTAAYNELYDPDIATISATHYYIQFSPTTHEQLELLVNSNLNIVEFPLDREIIHLGEFYLEPGRSAGDLVPLL